MAWYGIGVGCGLDIPRGHGHDLTLPVTRRREESYARGLAVVNAGMKKKVFHGCIYRMTVAVAVMEFMCMSILRGDVVVVEDGQCKLQSWLLQCWISWALGRMAQFL